ncbi:MAG: adenylate kinase [Paludibacteraceae bacterium]|jgi:adenylate kinase|nr:adenylate kinase [Paludibacteraceae bacterium]
MLNIVISGAPGSGKGTQSAIIVEQYGLSHISTGDMLREEIKAGTENGKKAEALINDGKLVPDEMIIAMLHDRVQNDLNNGSVKGFIFDGFPRTAAQAIALDAMLEELGTEVSCMLHMQVEHDLLIERLLNRGKTSGRADDNLETIQKRLDVYNTQTLPVIEHYKTSGRYKSACNNSSVEACFAQVKEIIDNL